MEKVSIGEWVGWAFFYVCFGIIVAIILGVTGLIDPNITPAEAIALIVFWPFFAIKFIAIGVWAVLSAGYFLLV